MKIILASSSPRRRDLLTVLGHNVVVMAPTDNELDARAGYAADRLAHQNACLKARNVADRTHEDFDIIVGADTVVVLDGAIFGKPQDYDDAFAMLRKLAGQAHEVITAYCLIGYHRREYARSVSSIVEFRSLDDSQIHAYLTAHEWQDKAGAYGVQGFGAALIRRVVGSLTNVIGLPIEEVLADAHELITRVQ